MQELPGLFMFLSAPGEAVRAVFHGTLSDGQIKDLIAHIGTADGYIVRVPIVEKFLDSGYHYTLLTLTCDSDMSLSRKLDELYPAAKRVSLKGGTAIRDALRAIIIS